MRPSSDDCFLYTVTLKKLDGNITNVRICMQNDFFWFNGLRDVLQVKGCAVLMIIHYRVFYNLYVESRRKMEEKQGIFTYHGNDLYLKRPLYCKGVPDLKNLCRLKLNREKNIKRSNLDGDLKAYMWI